MDVEFIIEDDDEDEDEDDADEDGEGGDDNDPAEEEAAEIGMRARLMNLIAGTSDPGNTSTPSVG